MSSVSLSAGDVSWCDSLTCDLCGVKVERRGTGVMERVQLSISDPRRVERAGFRGGIGFTSAELLPEIEFEKREFASDALKGWGSFEARGGGDDDPRPRMDLCPTCVQVVSDLILGQVKDPNSMAPFGTREERQYGKEVPAVPLQLQPREQTEELSQAIGDINFSALELRTLAMARELDGRASSHAHGVALDALRSTRDATRDAIRGVYGTPNRLLPCVDPNCRRQAMLGQAYCYEHAARGGS